MSCFVSFFCITCSLECCRDASIDFYTPYWFVRNKHIVSSTTHLRILLLKTENRSQAIIFKKHVERMYEVNFLRYWMGHKSVLYMLLDKKNKKNVVILKIIF